MWREANDGKIDIGKWQDAERPLWVESSRSKLYHLNVRFGLKADIQISLD